MMVLRKKTAKNLIYIFGTTLHYIRSGVGLTWMLGLDVSFKSTVFISAVSAPIMEMCTSRKHQLTPFETPQLLA